MKINEHYHDLAESYLFSTIADKVEAYTKAHPDQELSLIHISFRPRRTMIFTPSRISGSWYFRSKRPPSIKSR